MPQNSFCHSWPIKRRTSFFHYVHISEWLESQHHYHYFSLTLTILVSFENFDGFIFIKQLSKPLTKFHCKNVCAMSARCILKNSGPTQVLKKKLKTEPNVQLSLSETQMKIKIDHTFAHVWCSCSKLCKVSDEAFLADVSIVKAT